MEAFARARHFWDMSNYGARMGEWDPACIFVDKFLSLDAEEHLNFSIKSISYVLDVSGFFVNRVFFARYNRCIFLLAQKKFEDFDLQFE